MFFKPFQDFYLEYSSIILSLSTLATYRGAGDIEYDEDLPA
jgi:hypothetical protein